ncbi:membrane bound O-acyl transferase, MBOAT [Candidatus Koribacter versatilis Ellin345]|uniref:Membrane bound O-acyl transferase, MBOAT n=1 Tax=Koribacter versatilis (strain Ellin345) TaxID=204669 RepID=Q1ITR0_KORVE|nr:MBOAT family O-acyltransferase [Candidatus Koribacter versatilis]ABF39740.1 membrane bound O-acyl transferase, MBOAT [Candidatus Koribacter versatilis Ellin345]
MPSRGALYILVFLVSLLICARSRSRGLRQGALLVGCYAVYMTWGSWFLAVLAGSTLMNFLLGRWIRRSPTRFALAVGIALNIVVLGTFKYLPESAVSLPFSSLQAFAHLALPLGISFWTFQAMSYLFDLYREEELDPTLAEFAIYMAFFPVVISGPVCRLPDMLPQFRSDSRTQTDAIGRGLTRIATGVLMMQIARLLGQGILSGDGINSGFDRATTWGGTDVWCLAFGYGLQLFFDFAGYSHIAIGAAQALGFTVPENFDRPFTSTTPSVFWTRWHMSLSFWIRDYVFLPLAVLRREVWWRNLALVIAMVLFGAWHKATWLFVLWGAYHGVLLVAHRLIQSAQRKYNWNPGEGLWTPLSWAATMLAVNFGWIFFRANSWEQAQRMLIAAVSPGTYSTHSLSDTLYALVFAIAFGYAIILMLADTLHKQQSALSSNRWLWLPAVYIVVLLLVLGMTYTRGADAAQFMYRNF